MANQSIDINSIQRFSSSQLLFAVRINAQFWVS